MIKKEKGENEIQSKLLTRNNVMGKLVTLSYFIPTKWVGEQNPPTVIYSFINRFEVN